MSGLQMPSDALFGLSIQQGGYGQGLSDYLRMTLGYEHLASEPNNFSYYPLTDLGLTPVKVTGALMPEIGGKALTSGIYTTGTWAAGSASMYARLDDRLGWILLAAMGDVSTVADTTADNLALLGGSHGSDAGINSHVFQFNTSDQYFIPWLTLRRLLPHSTSGYDVGETFQDGRLAGMTMTIAAGAAVTLDLDMLARLKQTDYQFDYNPGWGTPTYDAFEKFAVTSCDGHFKINNAAFNVTAVTLTATNVLLAPQQSIVVGTTHPVDFPNLNRVFAVTVTFLVDDWDFYVSTFKGAAVTRTDSNAACDIYKADVDVMAASQSLITGTEPYRIRVFSNPDEDNAAWAVQPVRFVPNRPVVVQATCSMLALEGTGWDNHPVFVVLQNDKANYNLPNP